jgi:hypothetical protein
LAIGAAILILVPTTLAVGDDGEVQYARLGQNNFPGAFALVDAQLRFISERNIRLDIQIQGGTGRTFAPRVYVDGTCADPGGTGGLWMINRTPNAGQHGPFLLLQGNSNTQIQVNQLDVTRVRRELSLRPNQNFALMIATVINNVNYRTCTQFSLTPPGPITFTTSTTGTATTGTTTTGTTTTGTTTTGTTTGSSTTGTSTSTSTTGTTTSSTTSSPTTGSTTSGSTTTSASTTFSTPTTVTINTTITTAVSTSTAISTSFSVSTGVGTTTTIGTSIISSLSTILSTTTINTTFSTGTTVTL